eukprot:jgi/Picsp_1/4298/NSC_01807-R1_---NA---
MSKNINAKSRGISLNLDGLKTNLNLQGKGGVDCDSEEETVSSAASGSDSFDSSSDDVNLLELGSTSEDDSVSSSGTEATPRSDLTVPERIEPRSVPKVSFNLKLPIENNMDENPPSVRREYDEEEQHTSQKLYTARESCTSSSCESSPDKIIPVPMFLLTPAFDLDCKKSQTASWLDALGDQCAERFAVGRHRIKIFEIDSQASKGYPAGTGPDRRCAVEILGSDFSLKALEEILKNQEESEKSRQAELSRILELEAQVKGLQDKLTASETLRHKAQSLLRNLRDEFELLHVDILNTKSTKK